MHLQRTLELRLGSDHPLGGIDGTKIGVVSPATVISVRRPSAISLIDFHFGQASSNRPLLKYNSTQPASSLEIIRLRAEQTFQFLQFPHQGLWLIARIHRRTPCFLHC